MIKYWQTLLLIFLCDASWLAAQPPVFERFQLLHFTDQNGLPQNSVKKLTVDGSGYLWMATENGLTRFDGRFFRVYDKTEIGLPSNRIFALRPSLVKADSAGCRNIRFYAEDETGHYARIENGKAHPDIAYEKVRRKAMPTYKRSQTGIIEAFTLPRYDTGVVFNRYLLPARKDQKLYICTPDSITFSERGKQRWKIRFPAGNIWNFFILQGQLCFLGKGNSFKTIDESGRIAHLPIKGDLAGQLSQGKILTEFNLFWNYASDQLFVGLGDKVYHFLFDKNGAVQTRLLLSGFDMRSHYIQAVHYEPKEGIIWMGSITQGLYMFKKQSFRPVSWGRSEVEDVFYAQTVSPTGTLTTTNGMQVRPGPGADLKVSTASGLKAAYEWDGRSILTDLEGKIWLKHSPWLYQFDSLGGKQLKKIALPKDYSKVIYQSPEGLIWLGTEHLGLYYVNPTENQPVLHSFMPKGFNDITYIVSGGTNRLWIGTRAGLYQINIRSRSKTLVPGTEKWVIKSIFPDSNANVWLTVADVGIVLMKDKKLTVFPLDRNKQLTSAHCMTPDAYGYFWIPTNHGLFQIRKKELLSYQEKGPDRASLLPDSYQYFDQASGFLINEFNGNCQPCSVTLPDGTISLPSLKGLVWFQPGSVITPPQHPAVTIDGWELAGKRFSHATDTIRLPTDPGLLKIFVSTPYFGHPENLHIAFKLDKGRSGDRWYQLENNFPVIQLSSLNSGIHTLTIRKTNGFDTKKLTLTYITIIVSPYWYETWWAKLISILLLFLATYVFSQWRVQRMATEKIKLEMAVQRRTEELNQTNNELEASKNEVSRQLVLMSRILTSMSHDIRSPLHYIELFSGRIPSLLDGGQHLMIREISQSIHKSSNEMNVLLKDLLDYLRVNLYGQGLHLQEVNLNALIESKKGVFKNAVDEKTNALNINVPHSLNVITDYQLLSIIVHNLVDNACKYTRNGTIFITAAGASRLVTLTVSNNGTPISEQLILDFNRTEDEQDSSMPKGKPNGLGLIIVKEIAHLLNISVTAAQSDVTSFTIRFPTELSSDVSVSIS